jgi:hypothetical protein
VRHQDTNKLKTKDFGRFGWRKSTHLFRLFATVCILTGAGSEALAQELSLSRQLDSSDSLPRRMRVTAIQSDGRGIRTSETLSQVVYENARIYVVSVRSFSQGFGDRKVDQTVQRGVEIRIATKDDFANRWMTRLTSTNTRQDISQFGNVNSPYLFEHRTYSLSHGWQRKLAEGLTLELFAGVVQCQQADDGRSGLRSVGGLRFRSDLGRTRLMASLAQDVEGGGSFSSVYGSQLLRRVELEGTIPITAGVSVRLDCGVSMVSAAFREEEMVHQTPVVVASASLEFQFSTAVRGTVGYAHRKMLGGDGFHGVTGPMATAALTVQLF